MRGQFWVIALVAILVLSCSLPSGTSNDGNFLFARSIGNDRDDQAQSTCVDGSGNVYTTGYFQGTVDFDPGPSIFNLSSAAAVNNIFVSKLDSSGNFVWAKAIGGATSSIGYGICTDTSGSAYVTGFFWNTVDFDPGTGTSNLTSAGTSDIFVLKLDSNGDFVWAKSLGGISWDNGYDIALNPSGEILLTGYFQGVADFDPGPGTFDLTSTSASQDIFICKLNSNGDLVWAKGIGGDSDENGYGIAVDGAGNVYTTGFFLETADFDPGVGTYVLTNTGISDIFVSKLDTDGDFVWAKAVGGSSGGEGWDVAVDDFGNVYTTGLFTATVDFDPGTGTFNVSSSGFQDAFVLKLESDGDFAWAGAMGGALNDNGRCIAVDTSGNIYTSGFFQADGDFDPGAATFILSNVGNNDVFVSKLETDGSFVWAKAMSGSSDEVGNGIDVDASKNVIVAGYFQGTVDFDPGTAVSNLVSTSDSQDIFIAYLSGP